MGVALFVEGGRWMDQFMKRAVQLAVDNVREGGSPFGAVLVKDDEIIAEGANELHKKYDISGHAELIAIRKAQASLQTHDLSGYTMYASGEPCPMCYTSMYNSGIQDVYYALSVEDAADVGLDTAKVLYKNFKNIKEERLLVMKHMPLKENEKNPMKLWKASNADE